MVTGCAGFIGSHVTEHLLEKNENIIGVDNFNDFYDPKIKKRNIMPSMNNPRFRLVNGDIRDTEKLGKIFKDFEIETVVHLAACAGVGHSFKNPELYYDVNVNGTRGVLDLAARYKVKNFIFASSSSVYGINKKVPFSEEDETNNQISPYAKTKKAGEKLCQEFHETSGLNITCLRFFTVYGPRGRPDMAPFKFTKLISEGKEIEMFGDGSSSRDYTFVEDIAQGIIAAVYRNLGLEIINLGNERPIELRQLIKLIEQNVGKKAKIRQLPTQKGDVPLTHADISKARHLLGYIPRVSFEEGIKRTVEWYKKEYGV
jgi:UDP-glucuronate 4-epimerase